MVARSLLNGKVFEEALKEGIERLRQIYRGYTDYLEEFEWRLLSEEPMKSAIALGDDTDTTACITGGLAGIRFGDESIPKRWLEALMGSESVVELLDQMVR